jgi:hypothetical protein
MFESPLAAWFVQVGYAGLFNDCKETRRDIPGNVLSFD